MSFQMCNEVLLLSIIYYIIDFFIDTTHIYILYGPDRDNSYGDKLKYVAISNLSS